MDIIYEIIPLALVFVAVGIIAFFFIEHLMEVAKDVHEQQELAGDASLRDVYVHLSPQTYFILRMLAAVTGFAIGYFSFSWMFGIVLAFGGYIIPGILLKKSKEKRVKLLEAQLIEGLELLGNGLKSGLSLQQSCQLLVDEFPPPISQEFNLVLSETRLGLDFTDSLQNMADRMNSIIVHILSTGVAITKQCGGDMTEIFTNIASTIREQATIEGKLDAVTAQGRFQGMILGCLPFALVVILYFVDRAHIETLFGYQIGIMAFVLVIFMVAFAQMWIKKLLELDV